MEFYSSLQRFFTSVCVLSFLGLPNFADRDRFFGRDSLIKRLFKAVNQSSLSLVLGASGSGKSSVVRAGLIPELKKLLQNIKFYDFIFTPNQDPFKSFYRCLLNEEKDYLFSEPEIGIGKDKTYSFFKIIQKLKKENERWLIFIDQFEELFTSCADASIRQAFIDEIVHIANAKDINLRIIIAMRSDFLEQLSFYPRFGEIVNQNNIHLVTDMHPDELRQSIEQPAAKHGVIFEEGLVEQIIKDIQGQSGYLPLLQYTLDLLWENESLTSESDTSSIIEDRTLNWSTYNALGGVRGALQKQINHIYQNQTAEEQFSTKQIFLKLIKVINTDSGSITVSRRAYRSEFVGQPIEKILAIFIDENLLVSNYEYLNNKDFLFNNISNRNQHATIEIAHEILLSSWHMLRRWLEEEQEVIILKNWLSDETQRWHKILQEHGKEKANNELLRGTRLEQLLEIKDSNSFDKIGGLSKLENDYIESSIWLHNLQKQRSKRTFLTVIGSVCTFTTIVLGLSLLTWFQSRQIENTLAESIKQREIAENQSKEAVKQQKIAEQKRIESEEQRKIANEQTQIALQNQENAEVEAAIARVQTKFLVKMSRNLDAAIKELKELQPNKRIGDDVLSEYYHTWILSQTYDDPDKNKLTKLIKKSCPDAKTMMQCEEWVNRFFPKK